ncbi:MAG TPA: dephospho-CoA kinase [Thermoanaerobaculia bacterium]|jgi:dephospho-CoA kinase
MLRIGLTGGLASGKSTVAAILRGLGAVVFDADQIVRDLYSPGGAGAAAARELFGEAVLDLDGQIDRSRIAGIVFADPAKRHALEERIHPLVRAERARRFAEAERAGAAVAVAEASQLFESRTESDYDRVLLVVAPQEERLRRWEERGGDPEDARRRIAAQISSETARVRAQDVIVNDGTLESLRRKVAEVYRLWTGGV